MAEADCLPKEALGFLADLRAHNDKRWYEGQKARAERDLVEPARALTRRLVADLGAVFPDITGSDAKVGGSLTRLHRDTRFSKNKAPYKTQASAFFFHQTAGKEGAGIYLHLEPESCFLGIGLWRPDPVTRTKVSDAIAAKPDAWRDATSGKEFRKLFKMEGESLAKLPKQYDPQHPFAEDLKRRSRV